MRRLLIAAMTLWALPGEAATLAQIKTAIENWKDTHGPKIVSRQNAYAANHGGRFWQGIVTPGTPPDDGATVAADWTRRPTDQAEAWIHTFAGLDALPANINAQIQVDVYDGPLGKGWTITLRGTKNGNLYWRTWSVGPEDRAQNWQSCALPCTLQ